MNPFLKTLGIATALLLSSPFTLAATPAVDMLGAAQKFLGALTPEQKTKATYALTHAERENWNFVPIARNGLSMKEMTQPQRDLALALLRTGLGQRGLMRAEAIMSLENILKELEKDTPPGRRDAINYFVTVFGSPADKSSWGWRFEGHHLAFNFTLVNGNQVYYAPAFMGTNPHEVRDGPRKGERALAEEEDLGLALINSLDESQRKVAIFATEALREIVTTNKKRVSPLEPAGIAAPQLTPAQRAKLFELVQIYTTRARKELADDAFAKMTAAGLDKVTFAWAGGLDRSKQTYYRIQGPTFLIEFDNSQNGGNHVHSVYRDFKGDFGHDALAEHYAKEHQK